MPVAFGGTQRVSHGLHGGGLFVEQHYGQRLVDGTVHLTGCYQLYPFGRRCYRDQLNFHAMLCEEAFLLGDVQRQRVDDGQDGELERDSFSRWGYWAT